MGRIVVFEATQMGLTHLPGGGPTKQLAGRIVEAWSHRVKRQCLISVSFVGPEEDWRPALWMIFYFLMLWASLGGWVIYQNRKDNVTTVLLDPELLNPKALSPEP